MAHVSGTCLLMKVDSHGCYGFLFPGATADDSMRSFKKYMYDELCAKTPLNKSVNGVLLKNSQWGKAVLS